MISIVGLGNAASAIATKFANTSNYNVYLMNDKLSRSSKYKFRLKSHQKPEDYENNIPDLKKFFKDLDDHVQFIIVGSSYSSNYSLGVLEQIKNKKIDVFYVQPDIELLSKTRKMQERVTCGILQEYARSAALKKIYLISI